MLKQKNTNKKYYEINAMGNSYYNRSFLKYLKIEEEESDEIYFKF